MKTREIKTNKGITLIALVITIIVLLILAGVTIAMITGENGILTKTTEAKNKTAEAAAKEKVQTEVMASYGTDGKVNSKISNTFTDANTVPTTRTEGMLWNYITQIDASKACYDIYTITCF